MDQGTDEDEDDDKVVDGEAEVEEDVELEEDDDEPAVAAAAESMEMDRIVMDEDDAREELCEWGISKSSPIGKSITNSPPPPPDGNVPVGRGEWTPITDGPATPAAASPPTCPCPCPWSCSWS